MTNRPAAAELNELLEGSYNLPNATCTLGRVELGLAELQRLAAAHAPAHADVDAKAHYLLAGSGFNAEQVLSEIAMVDFGGKPGPAGSAGSVTGGSRVESYLSSKKDDNVFASIDQLVTSAAREFDAFVGDRLTPDWKQRKAQIYGLLGLPAGPASASSAGDRAAGGSGVTGALGASGAANTSLNGLDGDATISRLVWGRRRLGRALLGAPLPESEAVAAGNAPKTVEFAKAVAAINDARAASDPIDVPKLLGAVAARFEVPHAPQLNDCWDALALLVAVKGRPARARQFAGAYLAPPASAEASQLRSLIAHRSKTYLEHQYRQYIDGEIAQHRQEAAVGGVPSSYSRVRAFVHLKYNRNGKWDAQIETINKTPIWALLYYLVRCGHLKEAHQLVLERNDIFESVESTFAAYFAAYVESPDRLLSAHYRDMIHSEYAQLFRPGAVFDPFKQALYKIVGRCDLSHRALPDVAKTTEDWLWLQLTLVRELPATSELRTDRYALCDLQKIVVETGSAHFEPTNLNPGKYFAILALVGLYEHAVAYLYPLNQVFAVHYAIAFAYYGLLRPAAAPSDVLLVDGPEPAFDFASALGAYTRQLRSVHPAAAVEYLVLIALGAHSPTGAGASSGGRGAGRDADTSLAVAVTTAATREAGGDAQLALCYAALQELVLETRQFGALLEGGDTPGAITRRRALIGLQNLAAYHHAIAGAAAVSADEDGRVLDAILLFHLADENERVLTMVNHALGQTLAAAQLGQPLAAMPADPLVAGLPPGSDVAALARNLVRAVGDATPVAAATAPGDPLAARRETTLALLAVADAVDLLAKHHYAECLNRLADTGILVLAPDASVSAVREHAQQFSRYDESLARTVPTVLLMALKCCVALVGEARSSRNPAAEARATQFRHRAANIMVYAGLIQYRMPRDVYVSLTKMETELGAA